MLFVLVLFIFRLIVKLYVTRDPGDQLLFFQQKEDMLTMIDIKESTKKKHSRAKVIEQIFSIAFLIVLPLIVQVGVNNMEEFQ